MNRIPLIAGNWKMYKTGSEAVATAKELIRLISRITDSEIREREIMIAPSFLSLPLVSEIAKGTAVKTAAQNLHFENQGAFTGEVSAEMIQSAGAQYVLIGHSERRQFFDESDELVCKKTRSAIQAGLKPVVCIGETQIQREEEKTFLILDKQVSDGLKGLGPDEIDEVVLAYEPVWAIGTGKTADTAQVDEVHQFLRSLLEKRFSRDLAARIRILYGGSVNPGNAKELMGIEDVDGALVGGASLDANTFIEIIKY